MKVLVIIVTIIGIAAVIGSVIVGEIVFDGKVVDKPYETGLRYDEMQRAKELYRLVILNRELHIGEEEIVFSISDINGNPVIDSQIGFIISRPNTSKYDREYPVKLLESGRYKTKVEFPFYGYWDIKIKIKKAEETVILEKKVYVGQKN